MDLLIVADSLNGGLGKLASADAARLAGRGHRVRVLSLAGRGEFTVPAEVDFVEAAQTRGARRAQVRRLVAGSDWSVCHGARAARAVAPLRARAIQVDHGARPLPGTPWHRRALYRGWERLSVLLFDHSLSVVMGKGRGWQAVWYDHLEIEDVTITPPVREEPGAPLRLLWVGRVSPQKDLPTFARLLDALHSRGVDVEGHVMGTVDPGTVVPPTRAPLVLHGHLDRPWDSDVARGPTTTFVLFSHFEGRPLAVEEAIARGIPVLVSDLPGHRLMLGDPVPTAAGRRADAPGGGIVTDDDSAVRFALQLMDPAERAQVRRAQRRQLERARRRLPDAATTLIRIVEGGRA